MKKNYSLSSVEREEISFEKIFAEANTDPSLPSIQRAIFCTFGIKNIVKEKHEAPQRCISHRESIGY